MHVFDGIQRVSIALQKGIFQHKAQAQVFSFHQGACVGLTKIAALAKPVRGDIQFLRRRFGVFDVGNQWETAHFQIWARYGGDRAASVGMVGIA